ncbi:hypothetical protein [Thermoleptolyngbya sp. C42_A2020_037]|nr:hypothetical protein [Thermoleptolyngbya sp. C42_A2020_037]MBF2084856.1 hypothetical protein [Thermoleptolyngbya sp. C42_A2020_037]
MGGQTYGPCRGYVAREQLGCESSLSGRSPQTDSPKSSLSDRFSIP